MNSLDDLNFVLRDLERCAPELDDVRRSLVTELATPRQSVRRFVLPAAAAAAVAAVAVVAITLTSGNGEHRGQSGSSPAPTSTQPSPTSTPTPPVTQSDTIDLTWRFAVRPVPGYTIVRESISANDQSARVTQNDAHKDIGEIDVYAPGVVPRELNTLSKGQKISVNGHHGYFAVTGQRSATIWEYANGAWAEVSGDWGYSASGVDPNAARLGELQIANAVNTTQADPLRIDFTLGYVPSALHLRNTIFSANPFGQGPQCELDFVDNVTGVPSGYSTMAAVTITRTGIAEDTGQPGNTGFAPNMIVGGREAQYSKGFLGVRYPNNTELSISVDRKHFKRYPKAELVKIAEQAAPAGDPSAPSTWATGNKAVPR
jgi:hypothetical protein